MSGNNYAGYTAHFVQQSNAIEGIYGASRKDEFALWDILNLSQITIQDLEKFVGVYQPDAVLRARDNHNVTVGGIDGHVPPPGGPRIRDHLQMILDMANSGEVHPYLVHHDYETLHPFSDCNGRSGRALWAWQMVNQGWDKNVGLRLGFLHAFYYQALEHGPGRSRL